MCFGQHSYRSYGFVELASIWCRRLGSLGSHGGQICACVRSKLGPGSGLDMCAVWPVIQLVFGQECGGGALLLLWAWIGRLHALESGGL